MVNMSQLETYIKYIAMVTTILLSVSNVSINLYCTVYVESLYIIFTMIMFSYLLFLIVGIFIDCRIQHFKYTNYLVLITLICMFPFLFFNIQTLVVNLKNPNGNTNIILPLTTIIINLVICVLLITITLISEILSCMLSCCFDNELIIMDTTSVSIDNIPEDTCCICLYDLNFENKSVVKLGCNHHYHDECIQLYINYNKKHELIGCPLCGRIIELTMSASCLCCPNV